MLRLYKFDVTQINQQSHLDFGGVLNEAFQIEVSQQINGDWTLSFEYPKNGEIADSVLFLPGSIVECEGQLFRIKKMSRSGEPQMKIDCEHIFNCDSKRVHIQNIASTDSGDFISEDAYTVLGAAVEKCSASFHLLTDEELLPLGMERIDVNIDFESMDKTNLYDVMQKIIECAGMGEIYADNYNIAIVKRIGSNSGAVLDTARNMTDITVELDTSDMITRLYVYGKDNLEITNAAANTDGTPYVQNFDSEGENTWGKYGNIEGYIDYSDCTDADKLFERALWEIDPENPNRRDVPAVNISGSAADLSRLGEDVGALRLGDDVTVIYDGENFSERVISMTRHPYEAEPDSVSIGRVKKDMFFYLNQLGLLAKRYKSVSTNDGRIQGSKVSGLSIKNGEIYFNGKKILTEG